MPERRFADRYELEEQLQAAEGVKLFKAKDNFFPRNVFITVFSNCDAEMTSSFKARVQSLAGLSHHHIMSVFDMECTPDACYLISEYPGGITLREAIDLENRFSLEEAVYMATNLAEALAHAHKQKMYHGRLSSEMVWLQGGDIRLAFVCPRSLNDWVPDSEQTEREDFIAFGGILKELLAATPPLYKTEVRTKLKEIIDRLSGKRGPAFESASDAAYELRLILTKDLNPLLGGLSDSITTADTLRMPLVQSAAVPTEIHHQDRKPQRKLRSFFGTYFSLAFVLLLASSLLSLLFPDGGQTAQAPGVPRIVSTFEAGAVSTAKAESPKPEAIVSISPKEAYQKSSVKLVPSLIGLTEREAQDLLLQVGIHYYFVKERSDAPAGTVYKQEQTPGQIAKNDDKVVFYVSSGK